MNINYIFRSLTLAVIISVSFVSAQAQSSQTQQTAALDELVSKTVPIYAFDKLKKEVEQGLKKEMDEMVESLRQGLSAKLKTMPELTPEARENIMTNFGPFAVEFSAYCESLIVRDLDPELWVAKSLRKQFSEDLTAAQIVELNDFLNGSHGKVLLAMLKEEFESESEGRASNAEDLLSGDEALELVTFFGKPIGKKFLSSFDNNFEANLMSNVEAWKTDMLASIDKEIENGKLFEMLTKFMVENKIGRGQ